MPKRRYDPDAARKDILDAAERLFATHGFGDVSTSRIAKAAKVSQSQIHYHFESKRNLWMAVFERRFAEYYEAQSHMLASAEYEGLERMRASIRAYFDFFRRNPRFVKLLGRTQIEASEEDQAHDNMSSDLMHRGTEVIAEAQRLGTLRGDVLPEFILIGFLSLVAYWFQCRERYLPEAGLTGEPERYDDRYLDFIQKVYLKGIAP